MEILLTTLRVVVSLAAVLGLIWVAQRYVRRTATPGRTADAITVLGRQGVAAKASVVLVEAAGHRFLLGVTEHQVNVLHTGDVPPPAPTEQDLFSDALARTTGTDPALTVPETPPAGIAGTPGGSGSNLAPATRRQAAAALRRGRAT
ncbi:FliO/MopB family protein [Georgenia sp. AZ-5]|uniref:FliO/MopB family protein n=1 Tax=Georgenia sp. AZ-5 TaxID=3367526 RepID=UPI0037551FC2